MTDDAPDVYCFFQEIEPRSPLIARFERDYLLHAVKGALHVEAAGVRWVLPSSFAAWVPANTEIKVSFERPVTSCSVLSKPGFVEGVPPKPIAFQMSRLTREMAHHCAGWGQDDIHPPEAEIFFKALLLACAGLTETSINVARPMHDDIALSKAITFTEENMRCALTSKEVARAAGLSQRSMQRKFSEEIGESWGQLLTRMRMINALELLATQDQKIIQIAEECGYYSLSAFNRCFKEYTGLTPTEFRKRIL